jgi:hypothetical protein
METVRHRFTTLQFSMMTSHIKMSLKLQMETQSGRVYGPAHPVWIGKTLEILDNLRTAIGSLDPSVPESKRLEKIRRLQERLRDMREMAVEDDYWFVTLPIFLRRLVEHLAEVQEFWVPAIIREMIAVIEGLSRA